MFPRFLKTADNSSLEGRLAKFVRFCWLLIDNFNSHQGVIRASALTYTTILSLIPLLAIAFSVLKGFGVQNALDPLLSQFTGDSDETVSRVIAYVNNTNFKSIGAIGLLMLVFTAVTLLSNIEDAFNVIWRVKETRPLKRRFSDYLSVVIIGPILLLVATSMTSTLESQWMVKWLIENTYFGEVILLLFRLIPYFSIWTALTVIYIFIPNTRVKFGSAALGGVIAGTVWQVAQWGYFHFQVGVANYNAIYGTLAALPVFLVWIFTSWLIVLFGVEIVSAHQHHFYGFSGKLPSRLGSADCDKLSLALMIQICRHFRAGDPPPGIDSLSDVTGVPADLIEERLERLVTLGFLVVTSGKEPGWMPAREPSEVLVAEIMTALRGESAFGEESSVAIRLAAELIDKQHSEQKSSLDRLTLHDLASAD